MNEWSESERRERGGDVKRRDGKGRGGDGKVEEIEREMGREGRGKGDE